MSIKPYPFMPISKFINTLHEHMVRYGYQPIELPIIETADLFLIRAGDQIVNKLFTFDRYGQQLALRPEFTAAAAHYYAQRETKEVVRWQFYGTIFEDNPDNYLHDYQRLSMGAELIGLTGPAADAEIIGMAVGGIQDITDWKLVIGHIGLMRRLLAQFHLDSRTERFLVNQLSAIKDKGATYVLERFDRMLMANNGMPEQAPTEANIQAETITETNTHQMLDVLLDATQRGMTMGGRTRHDIARRLLQKRQRITERGQVVAALEFLERWGQLTLSPRDTFDELWTFIPDDDPIADQLVKEFQLTLEIIESYGLSASHISVQPDLARNWHYYTGIVFNIFQENGGRLGGGGRYDELVSLVSNQENVPAVGFAYYLDEVLKNIQTAPAETRQPMSIVLTSHNHRFASQLAHVLRQEMLPVQLIPEQQITPDSLTIFVEGSEIIYRQARYNVEQLDQAVAEIKRYYDEQPNHNHPAE